MEKHGCENLCTLIAIVHKAKIQAFMDAYEGLIEMGAVPKSARNLEVEDKDGNNLIRIVVMKDQVDSYLLAARKQGLTLKKFVYNLEQYLKDKEEITRFENR